ncbi:hypothetical protein [Nocardia thailandica]
MTNVRQTFLRPGRHALGATAARTVAAIKARLSDDANAAEVTAELPILTAREPRPYVHEALPLADPSPTVPLSRAELLAVTEVDGGRPLHDLDHIQRSCRHIDSLHGRCAACGMTWAAQADAIGGAL